MPRGLRLARPGDQVSRNTTQPEELARMWELFLHNHAPLLAEAIARDFARSGWPLTGARLQLGGCFAAEHPELLDRLLVELAGSLALLAPPEHAFGLCPTRADLFGYWAEALWRSKGGECA